MERRRWQALIGLGVFGVLIALMALALVAGGPAAAASDPPDLALAPFASGLNQPVAIVFTPIVTDHRMFVAELPGVIRIVQPDGTVLPTPFLDISPTVDSEDHDEMGLLGLAFAPDYASSGAFYVFYTGQGSPGGSVLIVSRFHVSADPNVASLSETTVLTINHPSRERHSGGQLAFGPDGFLYVATGDGGINDDAPNNAQRLDRLLGKILRLDVSDVPTYTIPASNPFAQASDDRAEIWAYGLRNPWRFSFDRLTDDLYIADVGEKAWEEINFQPHTSAGGENYGWHCYEGLHDYTPANCSVEDAVFPIAEYPHTDEGDNCVIGGYVYRGSLFPWLNGYYVFADNGSGNFWALNTDTHEVTAYGQLMNYPSAFGENQAGELFVASVTDGVVMRVVSPPAHQLWLPLINRS